MNSQQDHDLELVVTITKQLRADAAELVRSTVPAPSIVEIIPGLELYRESFTRAKNADDTSSFLYRCIGLFVAQWWVGRLDRAQMIVDFLQDVIDRLSMVCTRDVLTIATTRETAYSREAVCQIEFFASDTPKTRANLVTSLRKTRALAGEMIRSVGGSVQSETDVQELAA